MRNGIVAARRKACSKMETLQRHSELQEKQSCYPSESLFCFAEFVS